MPGVVTSRALQYKRQRKAGAARRARNVGELGGNNEREDNRAGQAPKGEAKRKG
jgi:hypothetical protein